mmetsp:Transcript_48938/g.72750  ORF Transcript_48938/g.72750 Transcript_48938/m.72750 type:complete len:545 (-) Transcript_48938:403-2037(-)|eukprot:CAMPEP_0195526704 /NCGR_PEP_ID=MMETSP0794_2-20130614/27927_1 /TAXON_ID=515487 /ORGANISM="Stephanopyxis turris, Strain CCMP 815" /LENGTH=544 /DNA_ID=CAMNT_0040657457 /DNA_START=106 /DNA_END=1740 /DNA_ORIENTATION=+
MLRNWGVYGPNTHNDAHLGTVDMMDGPPGEQMQTRSQMLNFLLCDLMMVIAPREQRLEVIHAAVDFFNHDEELDHNEELEHGAATVLFTKLAFAYSVHPLDEEVALIATALEMVYRGSRACVARSYEELGDTVMPLLVEMIATPDHTHPIALNKILRLLRYFSRVLTAMIPMAQHPDLIYALLHRTKFSRDENGAYVALEEEEQEMLETSRRIDAVAIIVNLACAEENKVALAKHPMLLDEVMRLANADPSRQSREHASMVIMNLAYHDHNKEVMAEREEILDTLVILMGDSSPHTRRYASAALFTLACVLSNTARMVSHREGGILEALRIVLLEDPLDEARTNAAEALFNMARNNNDETIEQMSNHPGLLESLADRVAKDRNVDVKNYAARALEWLAADIHYPSISHSVLLGALIQASVWTETISIAEAFRTQASLVENRQPMAVYPGLLRALANMALLTDYDHEHLRECAVSAIERLTTVVENRQIMAKHEGIMTALTKATFSKPEGDDYDGDQYDNYSQFTEGTATAALMRTALKNLADTL